MRQTWNIDTVYAIAEKLLISMKWKQDQFEGILITPNKMNPKSLILINLIRSNTQLVPAESLLIKRKQQD